MTNARKNWFGAALRKGEKEVGERERAAVESSLSSAERKDKKGTGKRKREEMEVRKR